MLVRHGFHARLGKICVTQFLDSESGAELTEKHPERAEATATHRAWRCHQPVPPTSRSCSCGAAAAGRELAASGPCSPCCLCQWAQAKSKVGCLPVRLQRHSM